VRAMRKMTVTKIETIKRGNSFVIESVTSEGRSRNAILRIRRDINNSNFVHMSRLETIDMHA